jgi:hypothetical protein
MPRWASSSWWLPISRTLPLCITMILSALRCAARAPSAERKDLFLCLPGTYSSSRLRQDSETYRAISSRPAKAGLEHRGWEIVMFHDGVNEINKVRWSDASQARASLPMQAKTGLACGPRDAPRFCGERGAKNCPEATFFS